jgi:hypothetical protein
VINPPIVNGISMDFFKDIPGVIARTLGRTYLGGSNAFDDALPGLLD